MMKRDTIVKLFVLFLLCCLVACEERHPIHGGDKMATSNITFEPAEFDVHVTATTDVVPFEYSRQLPPPDGDVDDNTRILDTSPDSEAKRGVHYTVDNPASGNYFVVYFEPGETRGRFEGLHLIPSAIKQDMKLIIMNPFGKHETLTINLIVD